MFLLDRNKLPKFAVVPEEVIIPGEKRCSTCTHYESEHMDAGPCKHLMYEIVMPEDKVAASMGQTVTAARQLCNCRGFVA